MEEYLSFWIFILNVTLILYALVECGKKKPKITTSQRPAPSEAALKPQAAPPPPSKTTRVKTPKPTPAPKPTPPPPPSPKTAPEPQKPAPEPQEPQKAKPTPTADKDEVQQTLMASLRPKRKTSKNNEEEDGVAI